MQRALLPLFAGILVAGCASPMPEMGALMEQQRGAVEARQAGLGAMMQKQRLMQDVMKNPDLPEWHEQRQKIVFAQGDRVFDKRFDRVFDSMTVALATLECKVMNMERASGYITATLPELPPDQRDGLRADALRSYAASKGYPPGLLDRKKPEAKRRTATVADMGDLDELVDIESTLGVMGQHMGGVTLSLVRQGDKQTKVKLRFDKVYYPEQVVEYYRVVWAAVDKQIFLDQSLD